MRSSSSSVAETLLVCCSPLDFHLASWVHRRSRVGFSVHHPNRVHAGHNDEMKCKTKHCARQSVSIKNGHLPIPRWKKAGDGHLAFSSTALGHCFLATTANSYNHHIPLDSGSISQLDHWAHTARLGRALLNLKRHAHVLSTPRPRNNEWQTR